LPESFKPFLNDKIKFLQEKGWDIVDTTKNKVDRFRRTMPLVNDLHNKSMRERHWKQIKVNYLLLKNYILNQINFN
jgi:hypothetical protein